jgi:cytochrome b561
VRDRYNKTAIAIHWLVAILVAANIAAIWSAGLFEKGTRQAIIDTHQSIGISVLALTLLRVANRTFYGAPPFPTLYSRLVAKLAKATHSLLYLLTVFLPLSGWIHDSAWKFAANFPMKLFFLVPWPRISLIETLGTLPKAEVYSSSGAAHVFLSYVLYVILALHILGTLKHHVFDRFPAIDRMLPAGNAD